MLSSQALLIFGAATAAVFTGTTAAVGLINTAWPITAYRRDASYTGLVRRALIGTYWLWIALLGLHLTTM